MIHLYSFLYIINYFIPPTLNTYTFYSWWKQNCWNFPPKVKKLKNLFGFFFRVYTETVKLNKKSKSRNGNNFICSSVLNKLISTMFLFYTVLLFLTKKNVHKANAESRFLASIQYFVFVLFFFFTCLRNCYCVISFLLSQVFLNSVFRHFLIFRISSFYVLHIQLLKNSILLF